MSNSPYVAPIDMDRKSDGSIWVCVDYRALNECTMKDSFPLPRIDDLLDKLRSAKCMTHLDLRSAYNQVRISDDGPQDDSIPSTAFQALTPNGASCFLEMLVIVFGLCNTSPTFSRLMNHVLEPYINNFVIVYLDDICIYSKTPEQHIEHLRLVLQKLREHQMFIKMPKFCGGRKETEYLGVIVGNGTLRISHDKIATIRDYWPLPEIQIKIKSFVQFYSYYGKFIHHFSDCAAPLTTMCRKNLPGNVVHIETTKAAFETLKSRIISVPVLLIPRMCHEAEFVVAIDASKVGIDGVLLHEDISLL